MAQRGRAPALAGYDPIAPGWPGEPGTVPEARQHPELVANTSIDDITAHYAKVIDSLDARPILIGHSFGGLFAEKLLGQGVGVAAVAIDPAQIKGVLPLPLAQLRAALPALGNPANLHKSVSLTEKEFRFGFGNALPEKELAELFEKWATPSSAKPLFEAATANFSIHSQAKVNAGNESRGPLLLISGAEDHTVPDVRGSATMAGAAGGDQVRARRLEKCRDVPSRPGSPPETISSLTRRRGFSDRAGPRRLFRAAYELLPGGWRAK